MLLSKSLSVNLSIMAPLNEWFFLSCSSSSKPFSTEIRESVKSLFPHWKLCSHFNVSNKRWCRSLVDGLSYVVYTKQPIYMFLGTFCLPYLSLSGTSSFQSVLFESLIVCKLTPTHFADCQNSKDHCNLNDKNKLKFALWSTSVFLNLAVK